jgi:hypothetical protein
MNETAVVNEKNAVQRLIGIFTSPMETFESIDRKPDWVVPLIINIVFALVIVFLTSSIRMEDQLASMRAKDVPPEQIQMVQTQMSGPMRYINIVAVPIVVFVMWSVLSGIFLFSGNTILGGNSKFWKLFSMVGWSSMIGLVGGLLNTALVMMKKTAHGVTTSLAMLLPTPNVGEKPSALYRLFSQFDLFMIWQVALWIIGFSVLYKVTKGKAASVVLTLWGIWIVLAVALGGLFSFGG